MGEQHLTYFKVENFKRFDSFEMEDIGQFNLLVGDNNVGKTSVLEALLVDSDWAILKKRLEYILFTIKKFRHLKGDYDAFSFFVNSKVGKKKSLKFTLKNGYGSGNLFFYADPGKSNSEFQVTGILVNPNEKDYVVGDLTKVSEIIQDSSGLNLKIPFIPFGTNYDHDLTGYYSDSVQLDKEKKRSLIEGLKKIEPNIINIEVNVSYSTSPVLLIADDRRNEVMPLANYGDGFLKLFRLLTSIVLHKKGRLMIDEIDTGIHYSRSKEFWKVLLEAAKENDVQLFATSHSKECMQYFTEALAETNMQEQGRIIRLAEVKSGVKAFAMRYEEFESSLQIESEIR